MIPQCPYCSKDTAGNHEPRCPNATMTYTMPPNITVVPPCECAKLRAEVAALRNQRDGAMSDSLALAEKVHDLEAEVAALKAEVKLLNDQAILARARVSTLEAELARYRAALEWYADEETYRYPSGDDMIEDGGHAAQPIDADRGDIARRALEGK